MPDPKAQVKAILADPEKRKLLHPTLAQILEQSFAAEATASPPDALEVQVGAHLPTSEALYNNITPYGYDFHEGEMKNAVVDFLSGKSQTARVANSRPGVSMSSAPTREDAWRLFLGLPQVSKTFGPSAFKPSNSKDQNTKYLSLRESPFSSSPEHIKNLVHSAEVYNSQGKKVHLSDFESGVMGTYQVDVGKDEHGHYLSYYDKWDLKPEIVNFLGKPFEIYGRQYYDPKTFEPKSPDLTGLHLKEIQDWAAKNLPAVNNARSHR